jgi:biopolymer transport protein TolR
MLQKGVDVRLPMAANTEERKDEQKSITVAVKRDSTTFVNGIQKPSAGELVTDIKERLQDVAEGSRKVFLKADQELPYSEVMKVMDLCREAGVEELALITEPKVQG